MKNLNFITVFVGWLSASLGLS